MSTATTRHGSRGSGGSGDVSQRPGGSGERWGRNHRRIVQLAVGLAAAAIYAPAVWSVGLRTDVGAHLEFAETMGLTGQSFGPYYMFEQLAIIIRSLLPFGVIEEVLPGSVSASATWDIAGTTAVLLMVVVLSQLVFIRIVRASSGPPTPTADLGTGAVTLCLLIVAPVTLLTWMDHNLLLGYVSVTSYENPTVNVVRPFAFLLFWVLAERMGRRNPPWVVVATVALSFGALHAKPSYSICLLPAVVIWTAVSRAGRAWTDLRLTMIGFVLPTAFGLGVQVLLSGGEGTIRVAPMEVVSALMEVNDRPTWVFLPMLMLSSLFPLTVAIALWSEARTTRSWLLAWLTYLIGLLLFCTLTFSGRRDYGDFIWGAQVALFILFVESVRVAVRHRAARTAMADLGPRGRDIRSAIVMTAFGLHVAAGAMLWYQEVAHPAAWW